MKKIIFTLSTIVILASCRKEKIQLTQVPAGEKNLSHTSYVYDNQAAELEDISYDANGRILTYSSDNGNTSFSYESATRLVATRRDKTTNSILATYECTLNDKGYITEIVFKNGQNVHYYTYQYGYTNDGYANDVKGIEPGGGGFEMKAQIVNGDITSIQHFQDGAISGNSVYSYQGAKANTLPYSLGSYWPSKTLFGKPGRSLATEYKKTDNNGTLVWHTTSSYEFDGGGYVTKATTKYELDGTSSVAVYQYK